MKVFPEYFDFNQFEMARENMHTIIVTDDLEFRNKIEKRYSKFGIRTNCAFMYFGINLSTL